MYVSNDIAERIKKIAKQRQVSVKQVLSETGLGRNTMSNLKTSFPQSDSIAKIADYLDCSVDYLLGRTDDPQAHKSGNNVSVGAVSGNSNAIGVVNTVTNGATLLDEHQKLLIDLYNQLSPIEQVELLSDLHKHKK